MNFVLTTHLPNGGAWLINKLCKERLLSGIIIQDYLRSYSLESYFKEYIKRLLSKFFMKNLPEFYPADFDPRSTLMSFRYNYCKITANKFGIPIYFMNNINSIYAQKILESLKPDVLLLFGGRIIKKSILSIPRFTTINAHGGYLPAYRGLNSTYWAIYNEDFDKIGYTIHHVTAKIDHGKIILRKKINYNSDEDIIILNEKVHWELTQEYYRVIRNIQSTSTIPEGKMYDEKSNYYGAFKV